MDGLVAGIDLRNNRTHIYCMDPENAWVIPTVICKNKNNDEWYVDEEAYEHALMGDGAIEDKLLTQVLKDGTATISGTRYTAQMLLEMFLRKCLEFPQKASGKTEIASLVISLETLDVKLMDSLMYCADFLGVDRRKVHIVSHSESFIYFVMSQQRRVWSNQVGMFDLEDENLHYYEMRVQRNTARMHALAESQKMEDGFHLDILENDAGKKVGDRILTACADRCLGKRLFSAIILTGRGFDSSTDWAPDFMKKICERRRVFTDAHVFAHGAALLAADLVRREPFFKFDVLCDGHLMTEVSVPILEKDTESRLILAKAGDRWYEAKRTSEFIVKGPLEVDFTLDPIGSGPRRTVKVPLTGFPDRPDRTTKIRVSIGFTSQKKMLVVIRDMGFGEIFPATDAVVRQEIDL